MPARVTFEQLLGITVCLGLGLAAHFASLPLWVPVTVLACAVLRLLRARNGRGPPARWVVLTLSTITVTLLFLRFHTFNGVYAGTALLGLMAGLKLLETKNQRDLYVITLIIYFVSLSALLQGDSFVLLAYLIGVCWLTTATMLRLTSSGPAPGWRQSLGYGGRLLAQALPLALVFWLLFPRFAGPLWQVPNEQRGAESGLSDSMSPGDIDQLALSDEVAFRVRFAGAVPPANERYWRGPVLHDFDGRTWRRAYPVGLAAAPLQVQGPAYDYTVLMQPHQHNWIYTMDWPTRWNLSGAALSGDYTLMENFAVSRPVDVAATSYAHVASADPLSGSARRRDTLLPQQGNPRTMKLAESMRSEHPDDMDYVRSVLAMFTEQPFYYTLSPPKLKGDPVDAFLFDTKRGFCEHYASAFAVLMRAAGIPARVVTGYQGGTPNPLSDYWILRQSDAHAWDEVWIDGKGWVRIDPTGAIAPGRVESGLADPARAADPSADRWRVGSPWLANIRFSVDMMREIWRERILDFDQDSQRKLLEFLHIPEPDGEKLVIVMAAAMALVLGWLTWQVRRELEPPPKDAAIRAYMRLCAKLAAAGLPRMPHEGAETYAARVARRRPDLANAVTALCRLYSTLRYTALPRPGADRAFEAGVRAFRPLKRRDSPASS